MALKRGLSAETIERLRRGQAPNFDQSGDSTAYDFATAVLRGGKVPDPVLESAIAVFGERGVVELGALIGHYHSGAIVLSVSDVVLPDGSRSCLD
jgi:4-carboxymuconolactone decarboxylase